VGNLGCLESQGKWDHRVKTAAMERKVDQEHPVPLAHQGSLDQEDNQVLTEALAHMVPKV
jgi:hypothetical protein